VTVTFGKKGIKFNLLEESVHVSFPWALQLKGTPNSKRGPRCETKNSQEIELFIANMLLAEVIIT